MSPKQDKAHIVSEFSKRKSVILEIDGADYSKATKYRGKQTISPSVIYPDGEALTFQKVEGTFGNTLNFVTVPTSEIRWYQFSTKGFKEIWYIK